MPAIILQYLPYLFEAAKAVPQIMNYISAVRTNLKQTGEWTNEMEASYLASLDQMGLDPAWQPDPITAPPPIP